MSFAKSLEKSSLVNGKISEVFDFIDDHIKFSSHMNKSSWMMGGSRMKTEVDEGKGQKIGSHIKMEGAIMGGKLYLDEVVTEHTRPTRKVWRTVGNPKLLVIGNYQMGVELGAEANKTKLKVFIDYDLPKGGSKILGIIFGGIYANWCVNQMLNGVVDHFN
jgi:hypothetical protein